MQTLDLNIIDGLFVQLDSLRLFQVFGKLMLILFLDLQKAFQNCLVIFISKQFFQFHGILFKSVTDAFFQQFHQTRIAVQEPAAECDTVGLIVKFFRINLIKCI